MNSKPSKSQIRARILLTLLQKLGFSNKAIKTLGTSDQLEARPNILSKQVKRKITYAAYLKHKKNGTIYADTRHEFSSQAKATASLREVLAMIRRAYRIVHETR